MFQANWTWEQTCYLRAMSPRDEWTLHPQTVQEIWGIFGRPEVDLFASEDNTHCQTYFSKDKDALAHGWPNLLLYAFPPIALIPQVIRRISKQKHRVLLEAPLWRNQHWFAEMAQLLTEAPWPISLRRDLLSQATGTIWQPQPELRALSLASRWEPSDLPESVLNTISQARAPSTRCLYALKGSVFSAWCTTHGADPVVSDISLILSFLQELLKKGRSLSTLKVHVAAIAAAHAPIDGQSVGRNNLVVRFLKGSRRFNPSRPVTVPTWDLPTVLRALKSLPFEPLQSVDLPPLMLKTALLLALISVKRMGDLQVLSVSISCLKCGPNDSKIVLKSRHVYIPKRSQLHSERRW